MKPATCTMCGAVFQRSGSRARYCPKCKPLAVRDRLARWAAANGERRREIGRAWARRNQETARQWRIANIERARAISRKAAATRNARLKGASLVPFSQAQLDARMAYFGHRCWMCSGPGAAADHVKPLAAGGPHMLSNLRPACKSCNSQKGTRWPLSRDGLRVAA